MKRSQLKASQVGINSVAVGDIVQDTMELQEVKGERKGHSSIIR